MTKIVLLTSGSLNLGKSMALNLAKKGIDIILTYHSKKEEAHEVVFEIERMGRKVCALQLDVGMTHTFAGFLRVSKR